MTARCVFAPALCICVPAFVFVFSGALLLTQETSHATIFVPIMLMSIGSGWCITFSFILIRDCMHKEPNREDEPKNEIINNMESQDVTIVVETVSVLPKLMLGEPEDGNTKVVIQQP